MIKAIFLSEERNGKIITPSEARVVAGKGIQGDRYFRDSNRKSEDYQITFIESEKIDLYNQSHLDKVEYWQPRRNILTKGIESNALAGFIFRIGDAQFEGIERCEPCELMKSRTSPTAFKWFFGNAGLRARILKSGLIRVGDRFEIEGKKNFDH